MVFAKDADDYIILVFSGGDEDKIIFRMDVKTGYIIVIDKNGRDVMDYLQTTLRAWYDDLKEKLLEDYHSGRYTVLPEWE